MIMTTSQTPERWKLILNFACVYLVWGSTYLAIKYAIDGVPPFLMAGLRFVLASVILFALGRWRGEVSLNKSDLKIAGFSGTLLVIANAMVCFAETTISSGLTAVMIGTMPIWIMLFNWKFFGGGKPQPRQIAGILVALAGILLLTRSQIKLTGESNLLSWAALGFSFICWTTGTLSQRKSTARSSLFTFSGLQLGIGGLALTIVALMFEDRGAFEWTAMKPSALWAIAYLVLFGSVAAFTSYLWLNQNVSPTAVSTYALVNPVVAVWLGWLVMGEIVTPMTFLFSAIVIAGLYLVIIQGKPRSTPKPTITATAAKT